MKNSNFYKRAEKLGQSVEMLKSGIKISSEICLLNVDELKNILDDGSSSEKREAKEDALFGHISIENESIVTDKAIMRRVNSFVYGNRELADSDRKIINGAFPITIKAVSAKNITYDVPEHLGTSLPLVIHNYKTVTMNDGGCAIVNNSQLEYNMDHLIRNGAPPSGYGDFNIFGVDGSKGQDVNGTGTNQPKGENGPHGNCSSCGIADSPGGPGVPGLGGGHGPGGNRGYNGLPSKAASFTINFDIQVASKVVFLSKTGSGGQGGKGGTGGKGGDGGDGGNGAHCSAEGSVGGNAGNGNNGGHGGTGGQGGDGIDADGGIVIWASQKFWNKIGQVSINAVPGKPGNRGTGGVKGIAGNYGIGGPYNSNGSKGTDGSPGGVGDKGKPGIKGGKSAIPEIKPL